MSKESTIWREASTKTLSHDAQLKYVDTGETRAVKNSRCIAEQIKSDRVEKVVMDGPRVVAHDVIDGQRTGTFLRVVVNAEMFGRRVGILEKLWRTLRWMDQQLGNLAKRAQKNI